jgi:transcriptional regulator GlxA family with amidase domain
MLAPMRMHPLPVQRSSTRYSRLLILQDAIAVMEAEYPSDLRLGDVAQRIATSPRQLQRCFSESREDTFRDCLTRIRLRRAAEMLAETRMPVARIAREVGYRQPAQFARTFARHWGEPPTRYRARMRALAVAVDVSERHASAA